MHSSRPGRAYPQIGVSDSHHPISHHGGDKNKITSLAKINVYHATLFAYFLEKLAIAIYEAAGARGATVVVPPTKTAAVSRRRPRASARDHTILRIKQVGRRQWKKEAGYHRQGGWRTPSSGISRSLATGFVPDIRGRRKPKRRSRATS